MSVDEIVEKVAKLSRDERHLLFEKLNELDEKLDEVEFLAGLDEARLSPRENDLSAEEMRENVRRWAHGQ